MKLLKHRVPSEFEALVSGQLEKLGLHLQTNISTKAVVRLLYHAVREDFDILHVAAVDQFLAWVSKFVQDFTSLGQSVHTRVLQDQLVPSARKEQLEALSWHVIEYSNNNAPIADCVAIAEDENGWGPYILSSPKNITSVILPLSPSKLAVGSIGQDWHEKALNYAQNAIEGCFSFYLSSQFKDAISYELGALGQVARDTVSNLTSTAIRETIETFVGDPDAGNDEPLIEISTEEGLRNILFSVSLRDFTDQPFAQKVGNAGQEVAVAFAGIHSIHGLDGLTFALDYPTAILELDRGEGVKSIQIVPLGRSQMALRCHY